MVRVQSIINDYHEDVFIPLDKCDRIANLVDRFLLCYQHLAYDSETRGEFLWSCPAKFHWLYHWSRALRFINTRRTNCYLDEDFVGRMATLIHSCAAGSDSIQMVVKMLQKYRWATHFMCKFDD